MRVVNSAVETMAAKGQNRKWRLANPDCLEVEDRKIFTHACTIRFKGLSPEVRYNRRMTNIVIRARYREQTTHLTTVSLVSAAKIDGSERNSSSRCNHQPQYQA